MGFSGGKGKRKREGGKRRKKGVGKERRKVEKEGRGWLGTSMKAVRGPRKRGRKLLRPAWQSSVLFTVVKFIIFLFPLCNFLRCCSQEEGLFTHLSEG